MLLAADGAHAQVMLDRLDGDRFAVQTPVQQFSAFKAVHARPR
jgi:hypothetical protein